MKKCNLCNSSTLMESVDESKLIPGAKYVNCCSCGNMMILSGGVLIPTPQADIEMTKAMMEDAANSFLANSRGRLMAASLTGRNCETHVQPTTVQQLMQNYVGEFIEDIEEAMNDEFDGHEDEDCNECEEECDLNCDNCNDGCSDFEEKKEDALRNGKEICEERVVVTASIDMNAPTKSVEVENKHVLSNAEGGNYLVILPSGEKQMFRNCSKEFLLNVMNNIGTHIEVFELKELTLKQEVKYSF